MSSRKSFCGCDTPADKKKVVGSSRLPTPIIRMPQSAPFPQPSSIAGPSRGAIPKRPAASNYAPIPAPQTGGSTRDRAVNGASAGPYDASLSSARSSLERLVEDELFISASKISGSSRAKGSKSKITTPPVIFTADGPVEGTHQVMLERTVNRTSDKEIISRHMTGVEPLCYGASKQIEINLQNMEPFGLNQSRRGDEDTPLQEIVSVTSMVTVGPGIRSVSNKTLYEVTQPGEIVSGTTGRSKEKPPLKPIEILKMTEDEAADTEKLKDVQPPDLKGSFSDAYRLKKKLQNIKLNPVLVRQLQSTVVNSDPNADEAPEELQPEVMAAMMNTEEKGLGMGSPPANIYNYLFPDFRDDFPIEISSVALGALHNVVIPVDMPSSVRITGLTPELHKAARSSQRTMPDDNIYRESVLKAASQKPHNIALKGKKFPKDNKKSKKSKSQLLLMDEEPPWDFEESKPVSYLVGASPSYVTNPMDVADTEPTYIHHNEEDNTLEYHLVPEMPKHISRVQLRGSQKPTWFPGYYIGLPETIKIAKSPSEVLTAAWQAVQPDIFADDSFLIIG